MHTGCVILLFHCKNGCTIVPQLLHYTYIACHVVQYVWKSCYALRLEYVDLVVSIELPLKCVVVSVYSFVKHQLKCNTGKVCNCLIQFLLCRHSWTSLPTPFISGQQLSEHTVLYT
jgi:hypothetical protein